VNGNRSLDITPSSTPAKITTAVPEPPPQPTNSPTPSPTRDSKDEYQLACLHRVLHKELPIAIGKDKRTDKAVLFAHHGDAGHWQIWNNAIAARFSGLVAMDIANANKNCSVWEVGANVAAEDSRELLKVYPHCQYHGFEPVPEFHQKLAAAWQGEPRFTVRPFGIGATDTNFKVSREALQGDNGVSTFLGDSASASGDIDIQIQSFDTVLALPSLQIPTLMQMNCEGCEWTVLPEALQHGWLKQVPIIQIGWHSYGAVGVGARAWELCHIRHELSKTHTMDYGLAFGWERWSLKTATPS